MKRIAQRFGFIAGFLRAALTEDSPPRPSAAAAGAHHVNAGTYRTAPLTGYRPEDRAFAERIFNAAAARLTSGKANRCKGSYSFVSSTSGETTAKIIIFERGVGRVSENFPIDLDGVYILLRVHGATTQPTIGVAPNYAERFTYQLVHDADVDAAVQEIVTTVAAARAVSAP